MSNSTQNQTTLNLQNDSIWALSEGAHIISVDSEILAYAVLDILAKPVSHSYPTDQLFLSNHFSGLWLLALVHP